MALPLQLSVLAIVESDALGGPPDLASLPAKSGEGMFPRDVVIVLGRSMDRSGGSADDESRASSQACDDKGQPCEPAISAVTVTCTHAAVPGESEGWQCLVKDTHTAGPWFLVPGGCIMQNLGRFVRMGEPKRCPVPDSE